ncbi:MAG: hypothetical protein ABIG92_00125 [Candidatus Omnitrophota bacterium]
MRKSRFFNKLAQTMIIIIFSLTTNVYSYETQSKIALRAPQGFNFDKTKSSQDFNMLANLTQHYELDKVLLPKDAVDIIKNMEEVNIFIGDGTIIAANSKEEIDKAVGFTENGSLTAGEKDNEIVLVVTDTSLTYKDIEDGKNTSNSGITRRGFLGLGLKSLLGLAVSGTLAEFLISCSDDAVKPEPVKELEYDFADNVDLENVYSQAMAWTVGQQVKAYGSKKQLVKSFGDFSNSVKGPEMYNLFDHGAWVTVFSGIQNLDVAYSVGGAYTWHEKINNTWNDDIDSNENTQTSGALSVAGRGWVELSKAWPFREYRDQIYKRLAIGLVKGQNIDIDDYSGNQDSLPSALFNVTINVNTLIAVLKEKGLVDKDGFLVEMDYSNVELPGFENKKDEIFNVLRSYRGGLPACWNENNNEGYYNIGIKNDISINAASTKDNARAGMFLFRLWEEITEAEDFDMEYYKHKDEFKNRVFKIANWLKNNTWKGNYFEVGTGDVNEIKNEEAEAQLATLSFFNMLYKSGEPEFSEFNPINFSSALDYVENNYKNTITIKGKDGKERTVNLYNKTKDNNQVSPPLSLHVASAYKIFGNTAKYDEILKEVAKIQYKNGGIPYLLNENEGRAIDIDTNWPFPSVEATINFVAAYKLEPEYFAEKDNTGDKLVPTGVNLALSAGMAGAMASKEINKETMDQELYEALIVLNAVNTETNTLNLNLVGLNGDNNNCTPEYIIDKIKNLKGNELLSIVVTDEDRQKELELILKDELKSGNVFITLLKADSESARQWANMIGDGLYIDLKNLSVADLVANKDLFKGLAASK